MKQVRLVQVVVGIHTGGSHPRGGVGAGTGVSTVSQSPLISETDPRLLGGYLAWLSHLAHCYKRTLFRQLDPSKGHAHPPMLGPGPTTIRALGALTALLLATTGLASSHDAVTLLQ